MTINISKTREQFPLSTKKIVKKTIVTASGWVGLLFIIYAVTASIMGPLKTLPVIILVSMLVITLLCFLYQKWYFDFYYYELGENFITIKKHPITPREINIPYERIQDVYVDQDILDRVMGIYDVHLSSATISSGYEAHIDGVEKQAADGLRTKLLSIVQEKLSRNRPNPTNAAN